MRRLLLGLLGLLLASTLLCPPAAAFSQEMHPDIGAWAVATLGNDGKDDFAGVFSCETPGGVTLLDRLSAGEEDADRLDLSRNHYYDPTTGLGLAGFEDAVSLARSVFDAAVGEWRTGNFDGAAYYLGRAVHLVQDTCMPHHVHNEPLDGHSAFEAWMLENQYRFRTDSGASYAAEDLYGIMTANAAVAYPLFDLIDEGSASEANNATVAAVIEPMAIRSSAGAIAMFMDAVRDSDPALYASESEMTRASLVWTPSPDPDFVRYELYLSEPGKKVKLDEEHLFVRVSDRTENSLDLSRLDSQGTYQFQLVTVDSDGTRHESNILQLQAGYTLLIIFGGTLAMGMVAAVAVASHSSKRRRR